MLVRSSRDKLKIIVVRFPLTTELLSGGPELTVLSNLLQRSIRVYEPIEPNELSEDNPYRYGIELKGIFGTVFDDTQDSSPPIHIFISKTGETNHACALIPASRESDFL